MTTKHFIAFAVLLLGVVGSAGLSTFSQRLRDLFFFMIVAGQIYFDRMDVNFISEEWYRGTTRGFETSMLDAMAVGLLIGCVIASRYRPRLYWPASLGFMFLFLLFEVFSVSVSQPKIFGAFEASKMVRAMLVFLVAAFYVRTDRELGILALALACTVSLECVYALKQRVLLGMDRSPGTFDHPNSLSLYICTLSPILVAAFNSRFPNWLRYVLLGGIGAACMTSMLTVSRAGIPVFALVMLGVTVATMAWTITLKKLLTVMTVFAGLGVAVLLAWNDIKERFVTTNIQTEVATNEFENRGQYFGLASDILKDNALGVGLNNWSYWVSKVYGPRTGVKYEDYDAIPSSILQSPEVYDISPNYAPPAHNLFVLTVGEMGWIGLFVFLLLWLRWFQMGVGFLWSRSPDPVLRMGTGFFFAVCGMFLQSQTEWVYRQTTVMLTFYAILGAMASLRYTKRQARKRAKAGYVTSSPAPAYLPQTAPMNVA